MKIALLSFHTAVNYGAALQAYALQKFLMTKGYDSEYINYVNKSRKRQYSMCWHIIGALHHWEIRSAITYFLGSPFLSMRKWRFNKFYRKNLKKTRTVYHSSEEAIELNDKYDLFIVGSDQVWNPIHNGNDAAFLLDFVKDDNKRISYSSSFGLIEINDTHKEVYKRNLERFKSLAVREIIGEKIVENLTGRKAQFVVDPVLLLSKEQWKELMLRKKCKERFIFSYTNREHQIQDFFRTGYQLNGRKHYKLSRYTKLTDFLNRNVRVKYCMSPESFLYVINNADLVVSASFHCIAFAIIFNRPFVAILTGNTGKDERILTLLKMTHLENRILYHGMTVKEIEEHINYNEVNKLVAEKKEKSILYLLSNLK